MQCKACTVQHNHYDGTAHTCDAGWCGCWWVEAGGCARGVAQDVDVTDDSVAVLKRLAQLLCVVQQQAVEAAAAAAAATAVWLQL
jgi:hypothetical protein